MLLELRLQELASDILVALLLRAHRLRGARRHATRLLLLLLRLLSLLEEVALGQLLLHLLLRQDLAGHLTLGVQLHLQLLQVLHVLIRRIVLASSAVPEDAITSDLVVKPDVL